jgi:hypothetical protein
LGAQTTIRWDKLSMNKKRLLTGLLTIGWLLVGGISLVDAVKRNLPVTCEEIVDSRLNQIPKSNVDAVTIQQWFASQYGISKDQVFIIGGDPSSPPPKLQVRWQSEVKWYEATIDTRSKQLKYIDIDWKTRKPQLSQVLSCNGDPEYYTLQRFPYDPPFNLQLSLWYPQKGFIVTAWNGDAPSINGQVEIKKLRLLDTFDINEAMTSSNTEYLLAGELRSGSIKKWAGLDNIVPEDLVAGQ